MDLYMLIGGIVVLSIVVVALGYRRVKKIVLKSLVEGELEYISNVILNTKINSQKMYEKACACHHLMKVEGFSSVVTLLKHRHVSRAKVRLHEFVQEWEENGLKLYDRK